MKTKYISEDGSEFDDKRQCKLYDEARVELDDLLEKNVELQHEIIDGKKFYKINSHAELWLFDKMLADKRGDDPQKLYFLFKSFNTRFPIWLREDARESKKSLIEKMDEKIDKYKNEINKLRDSISLLKQLDSRSKTPLIEEIDQTTNETEIENQQEEVEVND